MLLVGLLAARDSFAQAEAAPETYEPPSNLSMTPDPTAPPPPRTEAIETKWVMTLNPRLVVALGQPAGLPRIGFGAGVSIGRALVFAGHFRFGVGGSFSYERLQHGRSYDAGNGITVEGSQYLAHASFTFDVRLEGMLANDFLRPWLTLGLGFSIGDYDNVPTSDDLAISKLGVSGVVRIATGLGFRLWRTVELGPHVEVIPTFAGPTVGLAKIAVFQPGNFSVALDLGFRF